jgi:putative nucleotidyltransferase with HDIG domain
MKRLTNSLVVISAVVLSVVLTLLITQPSGTGSRVEAGQDAAITYKAPRTVTYTSELKTKEAQQKAADSVAAVFRSDLTAASQQSAKFDATVAALQTARADQNPDSRRVKIQQALPNVTQAEADKIATLPDEPWQASLKTLQIALVQAQNTQIRQDDLNRATAIIETQIPDATQAPVRETVVSIGKRVLVPNFQIDEEATEAARTKAKNAVEPVSYTVERDQVIVQRGQTLSEFDVERLTALGLTRPAFSAQKMLGIFLLVLLFTTLLIGIAPRLKEQPLFPRRRMILLAALSIIVTLAGVFAVPTQPILAYVVPVAAPAVLLSLLYGFEYAAIAGLSYAAFYALAAGGSFELFYIHLAATTTAVVFSRRISATNRFIEVGFLVAVVVFAGTIAFSLLSGNFSVANIPKFAIAGALNGALTASFVFAGAAFLGNILGRVTFLQLLELENPRAPLLRKLASEAPGTYSHSLRMAGLVESVAEDVGADPLLARVQTLYHDIGKTAMPEYFVENQRGENLHEQLTPKESAEVVRSHVSEGLALAQEHKLPPQVAASIAEHHGTTLIGYFWAQAKRTQKRPNERDFRYYGPKPQSKETAIIMLADSVEAASRTIEHPNERNITALIQKLFTEKINDGQLDDAPLTTSELRTLREAFTAALLNDLHKRIRYPGK